MTTETTHCSLGESCACARVGRAFRWIAPCPAPQPTTQSRGSWALLLPLTLILTLAYGLHEVWGDGGALLGVIAGLFLGFILLRFCKF
jgi:hypothetical protein